MPAPGHDPIEVVVLSLHEICAACGVHTELLIEMVSHGVIEAQGEGPEVWRFDVVALERSRKALRLRRDLEIDWRGLALALDLLEEVERLRGRISQLEAQLGLRQRGL